MFQSLDALYDHIEKEALGFRYLIEVGDHFQKLRDRFAAEGHPDEALLAQYEVDAFNLVAKDGRLGPQFIGSNRYGNEVRIPDITRFPAEEFDYFVERLEHAQNPRLRARYAHILWESPKKRQQYAGTAIEAYLEQIPHYESLNKTDKNDSLTGHLYHIDILECVKSALCLAVSSRQKVNEVISEVWRMIQDTHPNNQSRYSFTHDLMALVLENKKHFESKDLRSLSEVCLAVADQLQESGDLHGAIRMNELGQRVDQTLQLKTADWNQRIAGCYETLMERREKSPMVAAEWCQRAMDYYKSAGDQAKVKELALKRDKLGGDMEFQEVSTTIDQTDHIARCEEIGKELAELSTDELLGCIAADPNLLPLKEDMELHTSEAAKDAPLLSLIAETVMDDRMHVAEHAATPDEKLKRGILEAFKFYLKIEKVPLINAIMYHGFRSEKLDTEKVLKSIGKLSWIGATLKSQRGSNKDYSYCWLDQLALSIQAYFTYMKPLLEGAEPDEPPIMAIDSLTMKFEGLVRDFAQLNGILTHYDTKDKAGRTITREKDLSQLLYDPRIADLFNSDDLFFFRFLFIEQSGFTLRHRVAHSLMLIEDYNFGILQLLFVALMRLAKYRTKVESAPE